MEKVKYHLNSNELKEELTSLISSCGILLKLRGLGYINNDKLYLYHYLGAMIGDPVVIAQIELNELSEMDFLKKNCLILMDVFIDYNQVPKLFYPLNIKYCKDPETQLKGGKLKEIAVSMHNAIPENYPYREKIIPSVINNFDDLINLEDNFPNI